MQQVVVPQFLDIEDKIIGPVTVRQFIELVVCGLIEVIMYKLLTFPTFIVFGLLLLAATLIIAFFRVNGQPFHLFLLNFVQTLRNPKLKVWRKIGALYTTEEEAVKTAVQPTALRRPPVSANKISEIALVIDTGGIYQGENGLSS
jgi:hypothetical protein